VLTETPAWPTEVTTSLGLAWVIVLARMPRSHAESAARHGQDRACGWVVGRLASS
jgi:hypothetical protein